MIETDKTSVLREYFGYSSFRSGQEKLIDAILAGRDVLGVMPTGGGKSLCYQIPAMLLPGVTLVVSPLISLMQDQVAALVENGVPAAYINSSLTPAQLRRVYSNIRAGLYRLVYVAPERLGGESLLLLAEDVGVSLVAVDEAHCISQWGQDFRPSYLKISDFIKSLRVRPRVAAFTATATETVRLDIEKRLELSSPLIVVTGFDRPNLRYEILRPQNKNRELLRLIGERPGQSGVVYCATRSRTESVCARLCEAGIPAACYHAGLPDSERRRNQEDFVFDRKPVMVATNAFGMGIDKSNVRFVIHYNMPKSLEAYYQEAGRAGRDGEPADCILLYSVGDVATARYLISGGEENGELSDEERRAVTEADLRRLDAMIGYCKTDRCLRGRILDYFGQSHPEHCGNCSNCRSSLAETDMTVPAQIILSCVRRINGLLGYDLGAAMLVRTLRGSRDRRISELGLDSLSTYGLMKKTPRSDVYLFIDRLEQLGYIHTDPVHKAVRLDPSAAEVLFRGKRVTVRMLSAPEPAAPGNSRKRGKKSSPAAPVGGESLFEALKALRRETAAEQGIPAYMVFSDATLHAIAEMRPLTPEEFLEVPGVGQKKLRKYGRMFLEAIAAFNG